MLPASLCSTPQPDISLECQVSATGLKSADLNGKSDPYVRLTLAGQQAKSKTIMKSLDPQWDETFEFVGVRGELVIVCASPASSSTPKPSTFIVTPTPEPLLAAEAQTAPERLRLGPFLDG